jgi:hypothetical protein
MTIGMKRLLQLGTVFVLVLTACGAASTQAPQATNASAHFLLAPSVKAIAAKRRREAGREAERLLGSFVPPPGATRRGGRPPRARGLLGPGQLGILLFAEMAERHAFWRVHAPFASVVAFEKAHAPSGFALGSSRRTSGPPRNVELEFDGPIVGGHPPRGWVGVAVVELRGKIVLRVDAGAAWIYPRSPRERVPAGVTEIDLKTPRVSRHVHDRTQISKIVRWFDALNIVQPGTEAIWCPLALVPNMKLAFRSGSGAVLARSTGPAGTASACDWIEFSIGGHRQTALIDGFRRRRSFAYRLQRLLALRLVSRP